MKTTVTVDAALLREIQDLLKIDDSEQVVHLALIGLIQRHGQTARPPHRNIRGSDYYAEGLSSKE